MQSYIYIIYGEPHGEGEAGRFKHENGGKRPVFGTKNSIQ